MPDWIETLLGYAIGIIVFIFLCLYLISLFFDYLRRYAVVIVIFLVIGLAGTLYEVIAGGREQEVKEDVYVESKKTYVLPNSNTNLLTDEDVQYLSKEELRLARNEIFARHGYIFKDEELQQYFNEQSWYLSSENFDGDMLSDVEKKNLELIKFYEQ